MSSIAIVTDSNSSLPQDVAAKWNILQVPVNVHFGEETFFTGVDIDDASLFERIDQEKMPVYLETNAMDNIPYYERFGFTLKKHIMIPDSDIPVWAMIRDPQ